MNVTSIGALSSRAVVPETTASKPPVQSFSQVLAEAEKPAAPGKLAATPLRLLVGTPGGPTLEDLRREVEAMTRLLSAQLPDAMAEAGVRVPPALKLTVLGDGSVTALDHPDRQAVEAYMEAHPDLAAKVRTTMANAEFLQAADEAIAFQRAYLEDPEEAVRRFSHLFSGFKPPMLLTLSGLSGAFELSFTRA